jgi:hypothetical protein
MNLAQKRRCRRVPQSISPARRQPAPVVMTDDPVEWWFNVGAGTRSWDGELPPDPRTVSRVRRPRSGSKSRHVPAFAYSTTTQTQLMLESGLEHDLLRELDRRHDVVWLVAQPARLRLPGKRSGRRLEHTPDLLSLNHAGAVTVWDARAESKQDADFVVKADLTQRACTDFAWAYQVFTGHTQVRRANLMWLHGFRREPWDYSANLAALVGSNRTRTIGDVIDQDRDSGQVTASMWHAIWRGELSCDLDKHLNRSTPLSRPLTGADG